MRDRRVARVIDREIAPIWHDRFARLIIRNLPGASDVIALDIHCGVGRTTAELLGRLGSAARVLAIEPDDTLIEFAKTRMRPEWKNRVYLKPGNFDDVTAMADDSYNLVVANLVLGDAGDIGSALAEMIRVNRIGGRILATLPMAGSWHEVEDIFAEVLRDAGLTAAVRRLERLRELRPTGPELANVVRSAGVAEDDFVVEQERFQLLFPSGREFLFAPVVEHGPLRLWKAVIGKDGSPQELFWRLKEAIDTYYTGHVLAVNVMAGLMNIHVAKGTESPGPRLAARHWRHYPTLDALWGGLAAGYVRVSEPSLPSFSDGDFDFDLEIDEGEARRTGAQKPVTTSVNIIDEDFYDDAEPSTEALESATPSRPATRFSPAGRVGSEPARSMSTLASAQDAGQASRLRRPAIAEDDFSDLDDQVDPTSTFKHSELRDAFAAQHASAQAPDDDAALSEEFIDEPSDPTSTFRSNEVRAALQARPGGGEQDDDEHEADAGASEAAYGEQTDAEAHEASDYDEQTDAEAQESDRAYEPTTDEPPPVDDEDKAAPADDEPAHDEDADAEPEGDDGDGDDADEDDAESIEDAEPIDDDEPIDDEPTRDIPSLSASRQPSSAVRTPASESGARALHDSGIRRPGGESSGFTRPPSGESSGARALHDSGIKRPSGESSGFTRPPPIRPATGSFKLFAPPKPHPSEESGASPLPRTDPGPENESASALADLADLRDTGPASHPTPAAQHTRPASRPAAGELDEPEEVDELDELDDVDSVDDEPAPVTRAAPPPKKAPPPPPSNMFKPRPLLPIVPPKKK